MRKLHDLALRLRDNNFEMTDEIKNEFQEFLEVITRGSRIFHPRFGFGTVQSTQGNTWVLVKFDKENEKIKQENLRNEEKRKTWEKLNPDSPTFRMPIEIREKREKAKAVYITSCYSMNSLIKEANKYKEDGDDSRWLDY